MKSVKAKLSSTLNLVVTLESKQSHKQVIFEKGYNKHKQSKEWNLTVVVSDASEFRDAWKQRGAETGPFTHLVIWRFCSKPT